MLPDYTAWTGPARGYGRVAGDQAMKLSPYVVALVALGATVPALAADLGDRPYGKAPAYAAPIYNWTGFYIGGHVGGAISSNEALSGFALGNNYNGRLLGGVQTG